MKLSDKIKQLRNNANLTQPELAQASGIEQSYLSKLENDKGSPSFEVISKIAAALNTDAMLIIESLDSDYVKENLTHIPEIAAKATEIRLAKMNKEKRRYIHAAFLIVFGITCVLLGATKSLFSESVYEYYSQGVIKKGETLYQFRRGVNGDIGETRKQRDQRVIDNKSRIDEIFLHISDYKGESFIKPIGKNERRYFTLEYTKNSLNHYNDLVLIFGVLLLVSGGFMMSYIYKYKD